MSGDVDDRTAHDGLTRVRFWLGTFVMLTAVGFNGLAQTVFTPALAIVAAHFGGGTGGALSAQSVATMAAVGVMAGGPVVGLLSERSGARWTLVLSLTVYALAGSAGLYLDGITPLLVSRLIQGMGTAGISIATAAMIGDRFDGINRSRVLGYQGAFLAAAGFISLLISGEATELMGWRAPFALFLTALPMAALAMVSLTAEPTHATPGSNAKSGGSLLSLWPIYLATVLIYTAGYTIYLQLSFVLAGDHVTSPALQSRIFAVGTAMHFIGGLLYGRVLARLGQRWMLVATLLLMAASDLIVGFTSNLTAIVVACGLAGLGGGNMVIYLNNLILNRAPPALRGKALGFMVTAMYIGDFANPWVVTPLRLAVGNHTAFLVVGTAVLLAALTQAALRRPARPPAELPA